jgi:hypothetical protein
MVGAITASGGQAPATKETAMGSDGVMAMDTSQLALPKGPTQRQVKSRRSRADAAAIKAVRLLALERDGRCWFATNRQGSEWIHCLGLPELAHLPPRTRARTRGMDPAYRHDVRYVAMLCTAHHARVDGRSGPRLVIPTPLESL